MRRNTRKRLSVLDRRAIAEFRFAVIGPLLARPPDDPGLNQAVQDLAARRWKIPGHDDTKTISERTIWRWFGLARRAPDRMQALISSDGHGSLPAFDSAGNLTHLTVGRATSLFGEVRRAVDELGVPLGWCQGGNDGLGGCCL